MKNQKILKAGVYLRVSTEVQIEDTQLPDLLNQIKRDGANFIPKYEFRDKISGLKKDREGLNQLLKLTKKDIDIIYIWEVSRLSRDPNQFDALIAHFKERRINICFLKPIPLYLFDLETGEEEFISNLALSIFSKFALFEIQQKVMRQKRGLREAIHTRNHSYTSKPPYGYTKEGKQLVIADKVVISEIEGFKTEAEVIKSIFNLYVNGYTLLQIMGILNEYSIPTRNMDFIKKDKVEVSKNNIVAKNELKWGRRSIHNILVNSVYCGHKITRARENDRLIEIEIETPAIITKELFELAQQQFKKNQVVANKCYKNEFLLRGILKCGDCGNMYIGSGSKGKNYYACADRTHRRNPNTYKGCRNISMSTDKIDYIFWEAVKEHYRNKKSTEIQENTILKFQNDITNNEKLITIKKNSYQELEKEQKKIIERLGTFSDRVFVEIQKQIAIRERNLKTLLKEIDALEAKNGIIRQQIQKIVQLSENKIEVDNIDSNFIAKSAAVKDIVKSVEVYKIDDYAVLRVLNYNTMEFIIIYYSKRKRYLTLEDYYFKPKKGRFMATYELPRTIKDGYKDEAGSHDTFIFNDYSLEEVLEMEKSRIVRLEDKFYND